MFLLKQCLCSLSTAESGSYHLEGRGLLEKSMNTQIVAISNIEVSWRCQANHQQGRVHLGS